MTNPHHESSAAAGQATVEDFTLVRRSKRIKNQNQLSTSPASKFMQIVSDDLLLEIFLRLPNGRAVLQCATVCKRWRSLIINPHSQKFIRRFIQYRRHKQSSDPSYYPEYTSTTLFNYSCKNIGPFYQLSAKKSALKPYKLGFMPDWANLVIKATCGHLLLLSRGFRHYYICNSLTRQWFALPKAPLPPRIAFAYGGLLGSALVSDRNGQETDSSDHYRCRVVLITISCFVPTSYKFVASVFDSEALLWNEKIFSFPYNLPRGLTSASYLTPLEVVLTSRGVVHWLDGRTDYYCLAALDPFASEFRLVPFPAKQFGCVRSSCVMDKVRLGVVRGRLRLSRMLEVHGSQFGLKIWEVDGEGGDSWRLVHDVVLENSRCAAMFFVLAFDPNDGNVVFLVRGKQVYRYEIEQGKYEKVCEFPCCGESVDVVKQRVAQHLKVLTLVQPLWPTLTL